MAFSARKTLRLLVCVRTELPGIKCGCLPEQAHFYVYVGNTFTSNKKSPTLIKAGLKYPKDKQPAIRNRTPPYGTYIRRAFPERVLIFQK